MMHNFMVDMLFENRFWLQVLGDHARFIYDNLSPDETEKIHIVTQFKKIYDEMLEFSRKQLDERTAIELTKKGLEISRDFRDFKLMLIKEHLVGKIKIELPPTFINHMVNEIEEYIRIAEDLLANKQPEMHPLHYHILWLPDAFGHASAINCGLDITEYLLRDTSDEFVEIFEEMFIKAFEYKGLLRTNLKDFPALNRFNMQVEDKIKLFMHFLREIIDLRLPKKALGTILPLLADHMYREECYYLLKLARVSEIKPLDCDPTKPRLEK